MIVYPAIDIRGGQAVRLVEGDFNRETAFDADPLDAALRWANAGAEWIHIVDLDGARGGTGANRAVVERIRKAVTVNIQLGGGLRGMDDIDKMRDAGVDRLIIGSAAITNPELVEEAVNHHGPAIAVGLDARDGKLAAQGWLDQTHVDALEAARRFASMGVEHIIFTDIRRDGTFQGPNLDALHRMVETIPANIIASGGIGTLDDIRAVAEVGAAGVIIGSALYHGRITLAAALAIATGQPVQEAS